MATLPVAAGANGAATGSADAGVQRCDANLYCGHGVRDAGIAGVVQVKPQRQVARELGGERHALGDVGGHGDPDRVGEGEFVRPRVDHALEDLAQTIQRDLTLEPPGTS